MQKIISELNLNTLSYSGNFCGYASVFNVKDSSGDVVEKGAFTDFLLCLKSDNTKMPKLLWQHDTKVPIGYFSKILEDDYGLYVEGTILRKIQKGEEAYQLIKNNAINGLSIGYKPVESIKISGGRRLLSVSLLEISLVTFAANEKAKIIEIKNKEKNMNNNIDNNMNNEIKTNQYIEEQHLIAESKLSDLSGLISKADERIQKLDLRNKRPAMGPAMVIVDSESDAIESKSFNKYITKGVFDKNEFKSLSTVDKESGGYLVPDQIAGKIYSSLTNNCVMRKISNCIQISSSALDILIDRDAANAGWSSCEESREEHDSQKIFKMQIQAHEIYSRTKSTSKLLDDANIDVEKWIISKVSEKFSSLENDAFINGDGDNKPKGFLSYETSQGQEFGKIQEIVSGSDGAFTQSGQGDCLIDVVYSLKPQYLSNACWIMPRSVLAEIRKIKDRTTGRYLWQPSVSAGDASTLLGYPIEICDDMPMLKSGVASKSLAFGNFKVAYQIVDRSGIRILRDPFSAKPFVEFYITKRVGGDVVNFEAIKVLNFKSLS